MASKTVKVVELELSGESGLMLELYAEGGTSIANGSGDSLAESGSSGVFLATITESLSGIYDCVIRDSGGDVVNVRGAIESKIWIPGDIAGTYVAGSQAELSRAAFANQAFPPVTRSIDDDNPIWFVWPLPSQSISGQVSIDGASNVAVGGSISYIGAIGSMYEYRLAYDADDRPTSEGTARYTFTDGSNTRYVTLQVTARGSVVTVTPIAGSIVADPDASTLAYKVGEIRSYSVSCVDADGVEVAIDAYTLRIVFEPLNGLSTDKAVVENSSISKVGSTFTFTNPSAVTSEPGQWKWDLWTTSDVWLMGGVATVNVAAKKDA